MLWVERDPKLDFALRGRSLAASFESVAGSAEVVERGTRPTPKATSVTIAHHGAARRAELRGPHPRTAMNWYYLATRPARRAPHEVTDGVEARAGLVPPAGKRGLMQRVRIIGLSLLALAVPRSRWAARKRRRVGELSVSASLARLRLAQQVIVCQIDAGWTPSRAPSTTRSA